MSFKWISSDGVTKFYEFKVLPFGMCSAPYVFTKVLRQLVKYWRGRGHLTLMYFDDGLGGDSSFDSAKSLSDSVRQDIVSFGFTPNDGKSVWQPTQKLVFLGTVLDFEEGLILIPERHILKLKSSLVSCLQKDQIVARDLASITGQVISMTCPVGNVGRLFTRNCSAAIEPRTSWAQPLNVSAAIRYELSFWLSNIDTINGRSSAVGVVYSDASDSGFGCYFVQCGVDLVSGVWSQNDWADYLSRIFDADDWGLSPLSFHKIDLAWGPHSIDRFANYLNAKLPRFNSRFWNLGAEGIDAFVMDWARENNYVCPPVCLTLRVLLHMRNCKASGSLVVLM